MHEQRMKQLNKDYEKQEKAIRLAKVYILSLRFLNYNLWSAQQPLVPTRWFLFKIFIFYFLTQKNYNKWNSSKTNFWGKFLIKNIFIFRSRNPTAAISDQVQYKLKTKKS